MKRLILLFAGLALGGLAAVAIAGDYHTGLQLVCSDCHVAHYSQQHGYNVGGTYAQMGGAGPHDDLLRNEPNDLCLTCHDVSETHVHPFKGPTKDPRTGDVMKCTSCHNPHSSDQEHLLLHEKKRALCVQCHIGPNLEVIGAEPK